MRQRQHHATSLRLVWVNPDAVEIPKRARASIPVTNATRSAARGDRLRFPESTKDKCEREISASSASQTARRSLSANQLAKSAPTVEDVGLVASIFAKFAYRKRHVKPPVCSSDDDNSLLDAYDPDMVTRIRRHERSRLYLREWRQHVGLTQEQLAGRLDTYKGQISNYENGKRDVSSDTQQALADALGIDVPDLYRPPERPSADALLRDEPIDFQDEVIGMIQAMKRLRRGGKVA